MSEYRSASENDYFNLLDNKERLNYNLEDFEKHLNSELFFISESYDIDIRTYYTNENMDNTHAEVHVRIEIINRYINYTHNFNTDFYEIYMCNGNIVYLLKDLTRIITDEIIKEYYYNKYVKCGVYNKYISIEHSEMLKLENSFKTISFLERPIEHDAFFEHIDYNYAFSGDGFICISSDYSRPFYCKSFKHFITLSMYMCEFADYYCKVEPFGKYSDIILELIYKINNISNNEKQELNELYTILFDV